MLGLGSGTRGEADVCADNFRRWGEGKSPTLARATPRARGPAHLLFIILRASRAHPSPVKLSRKFFRAETSVLEINIDERRSNSAYT